MTSGIRLLRHFARLALLSVPLLTAACDDDITQEWVAQPDTIELFSVSRTELLGENSAYDFIDGVPLPIEAPGVSGRWDMAVVDLNDGLALIPASAFSGLDSRAGIANLGNRVLEEVREAPADTAAFKRTAVPAQLSTVYVVRSRRESCGFTSGVRYAKLEIISIDKAAGSLKFRTIVNPYCNDRKLIPPD